MGDVTPFEKAYDAYVDEKMEANSSLRRGGTIRLTNVPVGYMMEGLKLYLNFGIEPGGFMYAVLSNDLKGAVGRADHMNAPRIKQWVEWCFSTLPINAWGSEERVEAWIAQQSNEETRWEYRFE